MIKYIACAQPPHHNMDDSVVFPLLIENNTAWALSDKTHIKKKVMLNLRRESPVMFNQNILSLAGDEIKLKAM